MTNDEWNKATPFSFFRIPRHHCRRETIGSASKSLMTLFKILQMKKLYVLLSILFSLSFVYSQNAVIVGHWEGTITREGKEWAVRLDLQSHTDGLSGTADFPDYGLYTMPFKTLRIEGATVYLELIDQSDTVRFDGKLDGEKIAGQWLGLGVAASFEIRRIQQHPVTYVEEEIHFQHGDASLIGTLVKPNSVGRHPAIVFTHGSGNQTRTQRFYRSRAYLFAQHGIASFIYDRRGKGASAGGGNDATWANLADDAIAGVHALMARPDINPKQVGISGFSQGGWISPFAATRSKDIAFVLVGSAPGITPDEQNDFNVQEALRGKQVRATKIDSVMSLRKKVSEFLFTGEGNSSILETEIRLLRQEPWFRNILLQDTTLVPYDEESKEYITFDPAPVWEKVTVPVLSIWGEQDAVVPAERSRTIFEHSLRKGGNKDYMLKIFPNAVHGLTILQPKNAPWDWPRLAQGYQELMVEWLIKRVDVVK